MEHQAIEASQPVRSAVKVALLVDGDNISSDFAGQVLVRAGRLGQVIVKRVYLDTHHLRNWEESAGFGLRVARTGRDAADMLLAIEAVDLAHRDDLRAVVIASSDGGFAPLARYLVERGLTVLGLGLSTAPADWRRSCTRFEVLAPQAAIKSAARPDPLDSEPARPPTGASGGADTTPKPLAAAQSVASEPDPVLASETTLNPVDARIRAFVRSDGQDGSISIGRLGQLMALQDSAILKTLEVTRWREYLAAHPHLYSLDDPSPLAQVRWIGA